MQPVSHSPYYQGYMYLKVKSPLKVPPQSDQCSFLLLHSQSADVDMCASGDVAEAYPSMEGDRSVAASVVWTSPGQMATTVALQPSGQHQIAYVGTAQGDVIKVGTHGQVTSWWLFDASCFIHPHSSFIL